MPPQNHEDHQFVLATDGLRLHVRSYGSGHAVRPPVVCLPGLTRCTDDFDTLAAALAQGPDAPRRVVAIDYRGRGRSDYDPNPANYTLVTELTDVITILTALKLEPAIFIGTSRGGILAMLLATVRPAAIAGVVLNDIGPVIETEGLLRIKGYVGRLPQPHSFEDAVDILRRLFGTQFPKLTAEQWLLFAKRTFALNKGSLVSRYDPHLAVQLEPIDADQTIPPLWKEFEALTAVPVMVIRGANSDLLLAQTLAAMQARHPNLVALEVPDQGHAPLLMEPDVIAHIQAFVARCSGSAGP